MVYLLSPHKITATTLYGYRRATTVLDVQHLQPHCGATHFYIQLGCIRRFFAHNSGRGTRSHASHPKRYAVLAILTPTNNVELHSIAAVIANAADVTEINGGVATYG
jgi:7-cyano-7-deazaguanine synthase in queuosine biosynthesis